MAPVTHAHMCVYVCIYLYINSHVQFTHTHIYIHTTRNRLKIYLPPYLLLFAPVPHGYSMRDSSYLDNSLCLNHIPIYCTPVYVCMCKSDSGIETYPSISKACHVCMYVCMYVCVSYFELSHIRAY